MCGANMWSQSIHPRKGKCLDKEFSAFTEPSHGVCSCLLCGYIDYTELMQQLQWRCPPFAQCSLGVKGFVRTLALLSPSRHGLGIVSSYYTTPRVN